MSNRTAVANGADPVQQQAAADANAVQDACNPVAVAAPLGSSHGSVTGIFPTATSPTPKSLRFPSVHVVHLRRGKANAPQ